MRVSQNIIKQKEYYVRLLIVWGATTAILFIMGTPVRNEQVGTVGMVLIGMVMGAIIFAAQRVTDSWAKAAKVNTDTE